MPLAESADVLASRFAAFRERAGARGIFMTRDGNRDVAKPGSVDDAAACVRWAIECELGVGVGRSTGLPNDVVGIDLSGLGRVVDYRPEDMLAVVEAGVTLGDLSSRVLGDGLVLPPAQNMPADRTVGELLAGGDARSLTCGPARDHVLGLRFVNASGELVSTGSRAIKNATGYSLTQLLLGARDQLGVVVEATIRLAQLHSATRAVVSEYPSFAAATAAALAATPPGGPASSLEAFNPEAAAGIPGLGVKPGRAALLGLVEATGSDLADARLADLTRRLAATSPDKSRTPDNVTILQVREERRALAAQIGPAGSLRAAISAPRERIDSLAAEIAVVARSRGMDSCAFGEVGAGALTFVVRPSGALDAAARRSFAVEIARAVHANGGMVLDLRACGLDQWELADLTLSVGGAAMLRAAKRALDPTNVFRSVRR